MSYSFTVKMPTKAEAKLRVADEMASIVTSQPTHKADKGAVIAAASAFIDILGEPHEGDFVQVAVNGSLSWNNAEADDFISANVNVQASLQNR